MSPTPSLKTRIARLIHPVERFIDRLKAGAPKNPMIDGYLGYATPEGVVFRGRVLSRVFRRPPGRRDSKLANFLAMLRLFATDEVAEVRVVSGNQEAITDEEGYFSLVTPLPDREGWTSVAVHLADCPRVGAKLHALVPAADARFGIISDIDDTIMETGAYALLRNLWTSMTGNALTRHIFPDARALIETLHDGRNPVFYVSSSPWNLFHFLRDIFERNGVVKGPKFLRDLGLSDTQLITGTHGGHKSAAIDGVLGANPDLDFVLIGDTGQEDAHVYLDAHHRHPGRIRGVILREPGPGPDADSRLAIDGMKRAGLIVQTGPDFTASDAASLMQDQERTSVS